MKNLKLVITAVVVLFLTAGMQQVTAQATPSKVCHVFSQQLVESLPKAKAADKQLRDLEKTYTDRMTEMQRELESQVQKAQSLAETRTQEENERAYVEIQNGEKKLQEYYQNSQQAMAQKREDLLKPLLKEVREAIQATARAKGFEYVLDATTGTGVILADGYDITPDVKKSLGVTN